MAAAAATKRVLSIQSHVVHGYVGNKVATYPLQLLGFDVDPLNSVQFSNHTGYQTFKGPVSNEKELVTIIEGLEENELLGQYSHLLTGYIGNPLFLREIGIIVQKLRKANPKLVYVCDPVMGDNGQLYVPKELLPIYRDEIIPLADIITPNQYEVELLTGKEVRSEAAVWDAMDWFHKRQIKTVVISSSDLGQPGVLRAFLSQLNGPRLAIDIPKQGGKDLVFTGTGDLFASLFLAHSHTCEDVGEVFEKTIASLQAVIKCTVAALPRRDGPVKACERELKLVQSKAEIEKPQVLLKAQRLN
ncbi:pyridoxal kinase [Drosophila guanche]|uniref:Pyridoxal kinase n=1 Tax=Drosophila guanche TaxID=7266 RepID=A0A3B0JVT7_DROGU|nr:pyridoxal kinase [Drosophila guanche]SPP77476.1 blast:Pyridoxal kinase [Drosophila guanche]